MQKILNTTGVSMQNKDSAASYFRSLREQIIAAFEALDSTPFVRTKWNHHSGGGGEMGVIRGTVFEKGAVNFSAVEGTKLPMQEKETPFFATGVSLITHMMNPLMPTVHMNVRYIETKEKWWFGGGYDLTPMGFPNDDDTKHFHSVAQEAIGEDLYSKWREEASEYFYIKHRKKERGVGGIFFDKYAPNTFEEGLSLVQSVGDSFLPSILPIYERKKDLPYSKEEKIKQNMLRAHYVEFNLIYDRGTKFGFQSGGNPEAILCSMPPTATW